MSTPRDPADEDPDERGLFSPQFARLLAIQLAHGFAFSSFFLLPKFLTTELGAGPELIGRITATAGVAAVLSVPLVGAWMDRTSRRTMILAGAALGSLGSLGHLWVDSAGPLIFLLRAVQGIGFTVVFNAVGTLAIDLAPPKRLGQAIGIIGLAAVCMNAIAPAIAEPIALRLGFAPVFALAAGGSLLAGVLSLGLRERRIASAGPASYKHLLTGRSLAIFYVSAVSGAAFGSLLTFVPAYVIALGAQTVSSFFVAYTASVITIRLTLGSVADRWGRHRTALGALVLYGLSTLFAAWLDTGVLELLGAFFGIAHGLFYPALNALVVEEVRPEQRGSVTTFFNGSFNGGFAGGVIVLGALAQYAGYPTAFVTVALMTASAVAILAFVRADAPRGVTERAASESAAAR
jgi:MFS family permease